MKSTDKIMQNSTENMHIIRNKKRLGGEGIYSRERGEMFSSWIGEGKKVLDIGCRDGSLTKYVKKNNEIHGADIDEEALKLFEKELGGKTYHLDLNSQWPFGEAEFDAIMASEVLEHFYRPEEVIGKIYKTLKPGGIFVGSAPNAFSLMNRVRLFLAQPAKTALADPTHVHHFSYFELEKTLKKYFSFVELKPLTRFKYLSKISPALFSFLIVFHCKK